jgi:hypothetical protein
VIFRTKNADQPADSVRGCLARRRIAVVAACTAVLAACLRDVVRRATPRARCSRLGRDCALAGCPRWRGADREMRWAD